MRGSQLSGAPLLIDGSFLRIPIQDYQHHSLVDSFLIHEFLEQVLIAQRFLISTQAYFQLFDLQYQPRFAQSNRFRIHFRHQYPPTRSPSHLEHPDLLELQSPNLRRFAKRHLLDSAQSLYSKMCHRSFHP